jgi:hypothetical protein
METETETETTICDCCEAREAEDFVAGRDLCGVCIGALIDEDAAIRISLMMRRI